MLDAWISFWVVIAVEIVALFLSVWLMSATKSVWSKLWKCLGVGLVFGICFDLGIGKYSGIYDYDLGFGPVFLVFNGIFAFGIMFATVLTWTGQSFFRFYGLSVVLGLAYEVANYVTPVWHWTFLSDVRLAYFIVIFVGYCGLALMMAAVLHILKIQKFQFLKF